MKKIDSFRELGNVELTSMDYSNEFAGINYAKLNKGFRGLLMETRKFKACVKMLDTIAPVTITVGDKEMTHIDLLKSIGIEYDENGSIILDSVKAIWCMKSADGYMQVYRPVTGTFKVEGEDKPQKVYHWDSKKKEYLTVKEYKPVIVEKWNIETLLKGLAQIVTLKEQETRMEKTHKEFEALKKVYIFNKQTNKGGVTNKAKEIAKDRVMF